MERFFRQMFAELLVLLYLFGIEVICLTYAAELPQSEINSAQNQRQEQEIPQEFFKIKVNVALVTTDVTVIGESVHELQQEDFAIYDNGVAQSVSHFSRGQFPLAVALLIDKSTSVEPYMPMLKIAALSALRRLQPEDQVALFSFDSSSQKLSGLTSDRLAIVKEMSKIKGGGDTDIYDSIRNVSRYLAKNAPNRRRAVILVSDNCHWGESSADSARIEMLKASATLYGIQTSGESCDKSIEQVQWIASETGGKILDAKTAKSLHASLQEAISDLRLQYTLGFTPSNAGENEGFHKLTVSISAEDRCPGCRVLARSGYYAGLSAPLISREEDLTVRREAVGLSDQELIQLIMLTAGAVPIELSDIPFTVKASKQIDSKGQPQVMLETRIDFAGIRLPNEKDRRTCGLFIGALYADAEGKILGADWRTVQGQLDEQNYHQAMNEGMLVSITIPIVVQKQRIKVIIYDDRNDMLGSKVVTLDETEKRN